jgi:2,3-bisphosphoglycerate-independent phosphoglycerate mutase
VADKNRSVAMIFLDGVGIGIKKSSWNPFFTAEYPALRFLGNGIIPSIRNRTAAGNGAILKSIGATLGVRGLPQSGTGQTTLFTGVNAARFIGKHFGPYPYSTLRPIIEKENIFKRLLEKGCSICFANAYPRQFFSYIDSGKRRLTVTTLSCILTGISLHTSDDLMKGRAISADITNERWSELGYPEVPVITAEEAGRRFARLSDVHTFTLFEYFLTDHAGHEQNLNKAVHVIKRLDAFLSGVLKTLSENATLIITSDHGNVEDLRVKTHTRNPVPLWVYGKDCMRLAEGIESIQDVTTRIISWLTR